MQLSGSRDSWWSARAVAPAHPGSLTWGSILMEAQLPLGQKRLDCFPKYSIYQVQKINDKYSVIKVNMISMHQSVRCCYLHSYRSIRFSSVWVNVSHPLFPYASFLWPLRKSPVGHVTENLATRSPWRADLWPETTGDSRAAAWLEKNFRL